MDLKFKSKFERHTQSNKHHALLGVTTTDSPHVGASEHAASELDDDLGSLLLEDHQSPTRTVTESSEEGDGNDDFHEDPHEDVPFDTGKLIVTHQH